jgi:predicted porin
MIGGRFKVASVASIAAAGLFMGGVSAQAADLGGNCCADLEERVAELEATTARKGNRKVSLEVSGHVHESILLWDDGFDDGAYIVTSNFSRTRFRFKGSAKINADWSAGFLIEIGLRQPGTSGVAGADQSSLGSKGTLGRSGMDIRHQALYVKSKAMGTVWLGHTSMAVDGIADICLGCPISSTHESSLGYAGFRTRYVGGVFGPDWSATGVGNNVASNGARRQLIRYISPTIAGFVLSADTGLDEDADDDARWTVALRYAGEFGAVRVAGGIGYHEEDNLDGWGGSLSAQHTPTGLFIAGSYGEQTDDTIGGAGTRDTTSGWSVVAGVAGKWSSLGKTTLWGRYGEYDGRTVFGAEFFTAGGAPIGTADGHGDTEVISFGINQKIDAAAMEIYASYYLATGEVTNTAGASVDIEDLQAVMLGARIRF